MDDFSDPNPHGSMTVISRTSTTFEGGIAYEST